MRNYVFIAAFAAAAMLGSCAAQAPETYTENAVLEEGGQGQYKAIMVTEPSLEAHTIFRPQDLSAFGKKNPMPILVWGNGACTNSPWEHKLFLNEIASNGFFVVATGVFPVEGQGHSYYGPMSKSEQQIESIDWAIAQNSDKNSPYYHKLDVNSIAAAGMSCGGLQTLVNSGDERLKTIMICNSGSFINPAGAVPGMPMPSKDDLKNIHTPIMYLLGGPTDIAYENGMDDFNRIDHVPAFAANYPVGHNGTYAQPHGGEFAVVATAWLKWQLKGDKEAGTMFTGNPCGLASRPDWTADKKGIE